MAGRPVSFIVSRELTKALFVAHNLPEPGPDHVYQLWTFKEVAFTPAGLVREGGTVRHWIDKPVDQADGLALTKEPGPGGSDAPSLPALFERSL